MPGCLVAIAGMCLYLALLVQSPITTLVATGFLALVCALLVQIRLWHAVIADGSRSRHPDAATGVPGQSGLSNHGPKPPA